MTAVNVDEMNKHRAERAWIGVDLDGTLAQHGEPPWDGRTIHPPVPAMVARVRGWLAEGKRVKICTARVSSLHSEEERAAFTRDIQAWCREHIGAELEVTAEKDYYMTELWDDRAVGVVRDTGELLHEACRRDGQADGYSRGFARGYAAGYDSGFDAAELGEVR